MCAFLRYSAGGLAALLAAAYISASAETGISAFSRVVVQPAVSPLTVVNRAGKGDREARPSGVTRVTARNTRPAVPGKETKILEGCDPAFSPLTASAKNNYASRCLS